MEIDKQRYHVEGLATLRHLFQHLRIPLKGGERAGTLAGLFHEQLDRLPKNGDSIEFEGWRMTAFAVEPQGQMRALVEPISYSSQPEESA